MQVDHVKPPVLIAPALYPPASHYSSMLEQEGVTELLKALASHPDTHGDIKGFSNSILQMLDRDQSHQGPSKKQMGTRNS